MHEYFYCISFVAYKIKIPRSKTSRDILLKTKKNYLEATFAVVFLSAAIPALSPAFAVANSEP
jgi:hypothetical protein